MASFSPILLLWYIFPIIVFLASDYIVTTFKLKQRFNLKTPDITVPYFLLTILLLGISVVVFQAYRYREIMYGRFFKMFWRLTFLLSVLVYFILIIASVINAL
ncbi:hypothetical protein A5875_001562 [Enterococcus sp. 3H8_DIV0648]|nr:hypothetical protein A5875_001562 [Enterococcus sp. 3H8_DIV0648]